MGELEQARKLAVRIIGVYKNGLHQNNAQVPDTFYKYGKALVGGTGTSII